MFEMWQREEGDRQGGQGGNISIRDIVPGSGDR